MKKVLLLSLALFLFGWQLPVVAKVSNDTQNSQWAYKDIKVNKAWDITTGSREVVVAVIDNGFDTFHPDLRGNVWRNEDEIRGNGIDDDRNGYIDDYWGWNFVDNNNNPRPLTANLSAYQKEAGVFNHGTLVAGLIGAVGNNKKDSVGINWRVKLMNLKVVGNSGNSYMASLSEAVHYAVDNGADIINISMVGDDEEGQITEAINYAYEHKVAVIAAAGNNRQDLDLSPLYPICADANLKTEKILGVSAISADQHLATFSNVGSSCIDITAPGKNMTSLLRYSPVDGLKKRYSSGWSGTSFSTPLVSGAAALIKSLQPRWGPKEIFQALTSTTHHTSGQDEVVYASLFGAGLLQIDQAVKLAAAMPRLASNKKNNLVLYKNNGEAEVYKLDSKNKLTKKISVLAGVDDAVSFIESGKVVLITSKASGDKERIVTFYSLQNEGWLLFRAWAIHSTGQIKLAVVDINQDDKFEIIIISNDGSWQVYSQSGILLAKPVALEKITKISDMTAGDFSGDGQIELVVGAYQGSEAFLSIYGLDGRLKRKWWAYGNYRAGLSLDVLDYNNDGQADIVTAGEGQPVRIWGYKVKKLYETRATGKLLAY